MINECIINNVIVKYIINELYNSHKAQYPHLYQTDIANEIIKKTNKYFNCSRYKMEPLFLDDRIIINIYNDGSKCVETIDIDYINIINNFDKETELFD